MSDYAISYNGELLQHAVPGAQVTRVVVQPIPIIVSKLNRIAGDGAYRVRQRRGERTITVFVEQKVKAGEAEFTAFARALRLWAESEIEAPLRLPDYPDKYLNCALTQIQNYDLNEWYKPIQLVFTASDDPHFCSDQLSSGRVGTAFTVVGDAPANMVISHTVRSTLTNPQWTLASGYIVALNGTYTSGVIEIDTKRGYVTRNGNSLMGDLLPISRFYSYPRGTHIITGPSGGVISWRERWRD